MDHNDLADEYEARAEQNLGAPAVTAMATLAVSHRLAALYDLLADRLPTRIDRVSGG